MERMMHQNSWCLYHHFNINSSRGCVYTVRRFFLTQAAHITAGCSSVSPKHISAFTVARSEMTDSRTSSDPLVTSNAIQSQWAGQFQKEQEKIKSIFVLAKKMSSWKVKLIVCSLGWRILFCVILGRKERDQEKKKRQQVSSAESCDSLKGSWIWFADSCCLLTAAGLHRFDFFSLNCKANVNKLESLPWVNSTCVSFFPDGKLNVLWLWNDRRRN